MRAVILAIGNELVTGQTVDTNSAWLSRRCAELGIEIVEHRTVRDDRPPIAAALRAAASVAEAVLVTGGLGPTADDLSRQGLADALGGAELVLDERSLAIIADFFRRRHRDMIPANRIQAMIPAGAKAIDNPIGTAPGLSAEIDGTRVFIMPGVPREMELMFNEHIAPLLHAGNGVILHETLHCFGTGESDIGARIEDLMDRSADPLVGTTAAAGIIGVRITAKGATRDDAQAKIDRIAAEVRHRLGTLVFGQGTDTLGSVVGALLRERKQTLATVESCTGGRIGAMITDVPGSSEYYPGGVIAYANEVKTSRVGVPEELLASHGAVSAPVAAALAEGARREFAADWGVGVTGIAGPGGGTPDKPVGLVYIAVSGPDGTEVQEGRYPGTRDQVRERSAMAALNLLRLRIGATG